MSGNFSTAFITFIVIIGLSSALSSAVNDIASNKRNGKIIPRHAILCQMFFITLFYIGFAMIGDNGYLTNATHDFGNTAGSQMESTTNYGRTNTTHYGRTDTLNHNTTDKFDGDTKNDGTSNEIVDYIEKVSGYRDKFPSEAILKFRETFLNIDMMIIKDLRNLFFNLW